jgi:adenylate cyclase
MGDEHVNRRLTAILSADVEGYGRLMSQDELATVHTLMAHKEIMRELINQYNGRVVDSIGDNLLAEFASVVGAVQCALEIQNALKVRNDELSEDRRMLFRIGINSDDVIQKNGQIFGDGINITARLEGLAESGGICISRPVYEQVKNKLNVEFIDIGKKTCKNISTPIHAYHIKTTPPKPPKPLETRQNHLKEKPTIAVLPFVNLSNDPEQEYFSDGITDDIITDISKISGLFVIARTSTFIYKGQSVTVDQIANELGARYILEGSVRKAGEKVRINAQLIDSTTGGHMWAERYDRNLEDIFTLQDEVTAKIVSGLEVNLTAADKKRTGHKITRDVDAYDLYLRGRTAFHRFTESDNALAKEIFKKAIELDPNFAAAFAYLSLAQMIDWEYVWKGPGYTLDQALETAQKAVAIDDKLGLAHTRLGWIYNFRGEHDKAIASYERAMELDPDDVETCSYFAEALNYSGDPDEAIKLTEKAIRFDPLLPRHITFHLGHSYLLLNRLDDAVAFIRNTIDQVPTFVPAHVFLAVVYSEMDRMQEARSEIETVLKLAPGNTVPITSQRYPHRSSKTQNRFVEGLRKAGLPE